MDFNEYREFLLKSIQTAKPAGGNKFVACRCFYCPDGKNSNSRHFYIYIPQHDDEVSWYYCHKCHSTGTVDNSKLLEWGIYESNIGEEITKHNKKCVSKYRYTNTDLKILNIRNYISQSELSNIKYKYLCDRLGYNFSLKELLDLKICLNLQDILYYNNINKLTRNRNIVDQLNNNFLGFISIDNTSVNLRRLCDEGLVYNSIDKRYVNYKLVDTDNSERFYTIPMNVDLNNRERIKFNIAEGPFDILSIYLNCRNKENGIYTSIGGSNYLAVIEFFLKTYSLVNIEIHIYPDNDESGSNEYMRYIGNVLRHFNIPIYIHRNLYENQKDFGVRKEFIRESIIKL